MSAKGLKITQRDCLLIKYLFENKLCSFHQIKEEFFSNVSEKSLYRRLRKLKLAGFLSKSVHFDNTHKPTPSFSITKKSLNQILEIDNSSINGAKIKSDSPFHDLLLVQIRQLLEKQIKVLSYQTENMIKRQTNEKDENLGAFEELGSDACIKIQMTSSWQSWAAIEFEMTRKSLGRCKEKLQRYYFEDSIPASFFIFKDKRFMEIYKKIDQELTKLKNKKIFFQSLENLNLNSKDCIFFLSDGRKINLGRHKNLNPEVLNVC